MNYTRLFILSLSAILFLSLLGCKEDPMQQLLGTTWIHSFEEDQGELQCFRPAESYDFPPARGGRIKVLFEAEGQKLTYYQIGPADGYEARAGKWEKANKNSIKITLFPGKGFFKKGESFTWALEKLEKNRIFVRQEKPNE